LQLCNFSSVKSLNNSQILLFSFHQVYYMKWGRRTTERGFAKSYKCSTTECKPHTKL